MNRDVRTWIREVRGLTAIAVAASLLATVVIGVALALAHNALTGDAGRLPLGPLQSSLPNGSVAVLVLAAVLLTLASVIQSLLRKVDATLVRRRITTVLAGADTNPRAAMSERFLMEGWTHWVTAVVQAIGFSVILALLGTPATAVGVIAAGVLAALVGRRFLRRASAASTAFLDAQQQINMAAARQRRSAPATSVDGASNPDPLALADAVYRRDNEAFRLSAGLMTILSVGIIAAVLVPALLTLTSGLPLYLIVMLIWRQRVLDSVNTVGPFAWTLAVWRRAGEGAGPADDLDV